MFAVSFVIQRFFFFFHAFHNIQMIIRKMYRRFKTLDSGRDIYFL